MNLTYRILRERVSSFNRRSHGESTFHRIRKRIDCDFDEKPRQKKGYYVTDESGDVIFIDSRLSGKTRLEVLYHELTHALIHYPASFLERRNQLQAEIFSLIFLIPRKELFEYMNTPFEEIDSRLVPFLIRRQRIFERFGV